MRRLTGETFLSRSPGQPANNSQLMPKEPKNLAKKLLIMYRTVGVNMFEPMPPTYFELVGIMDLRRWWDLYERKDSSK